MSFAQSRQIMEISLVESFWQGVGVEIEVLRSKPFLPGRPRIVVSKQYICSGLYTRPAGKAHAFWPLGVLRFLVYAHRVKDHSVVGSLRGTTVSRSK